MKYLLLLLIFLSNGCITHTTIKDCIQFRDSEKVDIDNIVKYMNDNNHEIDLTIYDMKEEIHIDINDKIDKDKLRYFLFKKKYLNSIDKDTLRLHLYEKRGWTLYARESNKNNKYYIEWIGHYIGSYQQTIYDRKIETEIITSENAIYKGFKSKQNYSYYVCLKDEKFIKIWIFNNAGVMLHTIKQDY